MVPRLWYTAKVSSRPTLTMLGNVVKTTCRMEQESKPAEERKYSLSFRVDKELVELE